jgi:hypothetical protein
MGVRCSRLAVVVTVAVGLAVIPAPAPAQASAPDPLDALVTEMLGDDPARPRAAMDLYARAFAGYALIERGLQRADVTARAADAALLDRLIDDVAAPSSARPFRLGTVDVAGHRLSPSAAHRGHLALLLVGRARLGPLSPPHRALADALARSLARDVAATRIRLLPTYAGARLWPADNEVVAAALTLYARHHGPDDAVARAARLLTDALTALERPGWRATGLPPSALHAATGAPLDVPRGCALSWTVAMRALHDPASARALYDRYRARHWVDAALVVGLREWPPGISRAPDVDSGPIVAGIGAAASGLGEGAARAVGATLDAERLHAAAALVVPLALRARGRARWPASAIAAWAHAARGRWLREK